MTLDAQLDEEEPCMLLRQRVSANLDSMAIPLNELVQVRQVQGRMDNMSARQQESFATLAMKVEYEFLTLDTQIFNGDVIMVPAGPTYPQRYFRVVGTGDNFRAKGWIDEHVTYPCSEVRIL